MKIIIAGDGKVGLALTRQLLHEGHELVVIDSNRSVLGRSLEKYDLLTVPGNAAALGTLREAGAADADLLIAATSTDETNILCCLVAKRLNPRLHTIARVRSYEYAEQLFLMREELGLSMSVNPELAAASEIFRLLQFPSFIQRETFAKGRVEIVELRVDEGSRLCGVPLSQLDSITRVKVLVCAVTHGGAVTIPNGNYVLAAGDHIHVTAAGADLARLLKNLGIMRRRVRQVMLVGGGRITYYLAKRLLQSGVQGVVMKDSDAGELARAVRAVAFGGRYFCPRFEQLRRRLLCGSGPDPLTRREQEVLERIAEGNSTAEIARRMSLSQNTVETYRKHLFAKLGARNSVDLTMRAVARGLIRADLSGREN